MITETAPTLLTLCTFILLLCGLIVLTWGKKLPGKGSWLVWAGILALLTGVGIDSGLFLKEAFKIKIWMAGWIWSKDDIGAITVGVYQDSLSLAMSVLAGLISSTILMNQEFLLREPSAERAYASLAISTAGVSLAWNSLTPWLTFMGLVLTILGGFISMGSRWDSNAESYVAARFVWERASGVLLAFFGACVLATSRSALLINHPEVWAAQSDHLISTWIGSVLLVVGLFVQMQPFPLLGWIVSDSELFPPLRTLLTQIFPAWAAFSLLLRLEPQLNQLGLFPGFGWFALCSSVLTVLAGLFQKKWKLTLSTWLAAGFSLSCSLLAFSGPVPSLGMMIGVSLGAMILAGSSTALESESEPTDSNKKRAIWLQIALFAGAASGTGVLGFVSSMGNLRWIEQATGLPALAASFLSVFFIFVLLGWRIVWKVIRLPRSTSASWLSIFSLFILVTLSLGIVWTGTVSGSVLMGDPDRLFGSLFSYFFGDKVLEISNAEDFITASGLYWGSIILSFATAYWTSGRAEDRWVALANAIPRASQFIASGYGIDSIVHRLNAGIIWFGKSAENLIDYKIWGHWVPKGMVFGIQSVSTVVNRIDIKISSSLGIGLKKAVETPAKFLQLIQTGDLRWYLFFALGSGFGLLVYFLRI